MKKNQFYLTTPIYYVNDLPHIGHSCTTIIADIIARYHRLKGEEVFFLTGTDEHGENIAQAAAKAGLPPQEFCDQVSQRFRQAWKKLQIEFDFFIRTTDPNHIRVVQQVLEKIKKRGDIYKGQYQGFYCLGCEKFLTEKELVDGRCPYHPGKKIIFKKEENYFFRLSRYLPQLIKLIKNDQTNFVFPEGKRREILSKLEQGVEDVSISREKVRWGVPFPGDPKHTVYVWVDALLNYYSATQFLPGKKKFWPADLHLIGKEILWFHTVIWPAMLLSAQLPLPKKVFAHSFYTLEGGKMSKSEGNVISPEEMVKKFGSDGSRYLIAASFPVENDSNIGWKKFQEKYNADLANNWGNLILRVAHLGQKLKLTSPSFKKEFYPQLDVFFEQLKIPASINFIWQKKIDPLNLFLNQEKPWQKPPSQAKEIIKKITLKIQQINYNLSPFLPQTTKKVSQIFSPGKLITPPPKPLFPRIK